MRKESINEIAKVWWALFGIIATQIRLYHLHEFQISVSVFCSGENWVRKSQLCIGYNLKNQTCKWAYFFIFLCYSLFPCFHTTLTFKIRGTTKKQSDLEANGQTYKNKERSRNLHTNKHKKQRKSKSISTHMHTKRNR